MEHEMIEEYEFGIKKKGTFVSILNTLILLEREELYYPDDTQPLAGN